VLCSALVHLLLDCIKSVLHCYTAQTTSTLTHAATSLLTHEQDASAAAPTNRLLLPDNLIRTAANYLVVHGVPEGMVRQMWRYCSELLNESRADRITLSRLSLVVSLVERMSVSFCNTQ
jgi:hypothetical protein